MIDDPAAAGPAGRPAPAAGAAPSVYRPGAVRLLAVGWWVLAAVLAGDLLLRGGPGAGREVGLALLVFSAALVHALFWQPEVRVDPEGVELVNVLRRVRLPWSAVEDVDTRWALSLGAGGRRWTSWAAPASGRRVRPVSRKETPWAERGAEAIRGSEAPGSSAGEAAVLVGTAWQTWQDRSRRGADTAATGDGTDGRTAGPQVRWNRPVVVSLATTGALLALAVLLRALA